MTSLRYDPEPWETDIPSSEWTRLLVARIEARRDNVKSNLAACARLLPSSAIMVQLMQKLPTLTDVVSILRLLRHTDISHAWCPAGSYAPHRLWRSLYELACIYVAASLSPPTLALVVLDVLQTSDLMYVYSNGTTSLETEMTFYVDGLTMNGSAIVKLSDIRSCIRTAHASLLVPPVQYRLRRVDGAGPVIRSCISSLEKVGVPTLITDSGHAVTTVAGRLEQMEQQILPLLDAVTGPNLFIELITADRTGFVVYNPDTMFWPGCTVLDQAYGLIMPAAMEPRWLQPSRGFVGDAHARRTFLLFGRMLGLPAVFCCTVQHRHSSRLFAALLVNAVTPVMSDSTLIAMLAPSTIPSTLQFDRAATSSEMYTNILRMHQAGMALLQPAPTRSPGTTPELDTESPVSDVEFTFVSDWSVVWAAWMTPALTHVAWRQLATVLLERQPMLQEALDTPALCAAVLEGVSVHLKTMHARLQTGLVISVLKGATDGDQNITLDMTYFLRDARRHHIVPATISAGSTPPATNKRRHTEFTDVLGRPHKMTRTRYANTSTVVGRTCSHLLTDLPTVSFNVSH